MRTIGGQFEDIDKILSSLMRGEKFYVVMRSLLTDAISQVGRSVWSHNDPVVCCDEYL